VQHHQHQPITVVAILGSDTVVENALAQLLTGEGYSTTVLKTSPMGEALVEEEMPLGGGADLVVLTPSLSTSKCDAFLAARRRTTPHRTTPPPSSPIPVIVLCSPMKEAPALLEEEEEAVRSVPWPTSRERLVREIEDVLHQQSSRLAAHKESASAREKMGYTGDTP
jgi:hypothetical protein